MNAGVNAAVMQPTRKIAVTDKRKKEDEGSVFYELLELGACIDVYKRQEAGMNISPETILMWADKKMYALKNTKKHSKSHGR